MRITDDRYTRDLERLNLAVRMIRHEARTQTIRTWTGLTDDRIRKLYRTYVAFQGADVKRHRGRSPRQTAFFLRNLETRREAAGLAGLFALLGLLHGAAQDRRPGGTLAMLRWGELFCRAYETHVALHRSHRITFEHACHLLHVLERNAELGLDECPDCGALVVVDLARIAGTGRRCVWCERDDRHAQPRLRPVRTRALAAPAAAG